MKKECVKCVWVAGSILILIIAGFVAYNYSKTIGSVTYPVEANRQFLAASFSCANGASSDLTSKNCRSAAYWKNFADKFCRNLCEPTEDMNLDNLNVGTDHSCDMSVLRLFKECEGNVVQPVGGGSVQIGEDCTEDAECVYAAFCEGAPYGKCQYTQNVPTGGACVADLQCANGVCANGVCAALTTTERITTGTGTGTETWTPIETTTTTAVYEYGCFPEYYWETTETCETTTTIMTSFFASLIDFISAPMIPMVSAGVFEPPKDSVWAQISHALFNTPLPSQLAEAEWRKTLKRPVYTQTAHVVGDSGTNYIGKSTSSDPYTATKGALEDAKQKAIAANDLNPDRWVKAEFTDTGNIVTNLIKISSCTSSETLKDPENPCGTGPCQAQSPTGGIADVKCVYGVYTNPSDPSKKEQYKKFGCVCPSSGNWETIDESNHLPAGSYIVCADKSKPCETNTISGTVRCYSLCSS